MSEQQDNVKKYWHVLNFIKKLGRPSAQQEIDLFNKDGHSLQLYAPIIRPAHLVNGKIVYRDRLLTYNYIFVKGTQDDVKKLCARDGNGMSLLLNRGSSNRYATLTDDEMENFKIIARVHTNTIPFFNIEDIDLQEGDKVEVVSGEYKGLKGIFMPKARSNKGNLVIAATAGLGAVLWDIEAKYIRILEFAPFTRRQYDLVDSFIPKLFPILRKFHADERLTDKEKSLLTIFNQRMGTVVPDNHKLEAKLLATLMCVQTIIGDRAGYKSSSARYEKRKYAVTNPWTIALISLLLSVATNDLPRLSAAFATLSSCGIPAATLSPVESLSPLGETKQQLLTEYRHYLTP